MYELDQVLHRDDCPDVPVGSIVEGPSNYRAVRTYVGWLDTGPRTFPPRSLGEITRDPRLTVIGEPGQETLHHFKQRFATVAIGRAFANGINRPPVQRIIRACEIEEYTPSLGMYVDIADEDLRNRLPDGTIIQSGTPDIWGLYNLWIKRSRGWHWLTGGNSTSEGGVIIELPGSSEPEAWYSAEWQETDPDLIDELKNRILDLGARAKSENGWCGQYEQTLERLCVIRKPRRPGGPTVNADGWIEAERPQWREGDVVTRRNRPHTVGGNGNYTEAEPGERGVIRSQDTSYGIRDSERFGHQWSVRWDNGRQSIIDGVCLMLHDQDIRVGDRVCRAYGQRLTYGNDRYDDQTPAGGIGTVTEVEDDTIYLNWDEGSSRICYDASCLEVIAHPDEAVEPEEGDEGTTTRLFAVGDRVRMISAEYIYLGENRADWARIARQGQTGMVRSASRAGANIPHVSVRWDHGGLASIDMACLQMASDPYPVVSPEPPREIQVGDQVRLISRFAHRGRHMDEWDTRFGRVGDIGNVTDASNADTLNVQWPNGTDSRYPSYVDRACVELVTDDETTEQTGPIPNGTRVRLAATYTIEGSETGPDGARYRQQIAREGAVGTVVRRSSRHPDTVAVVRWDDVIGGPRERRVDESCLTRVEDAPVEDRPIGVGDRVRRLDTPRMIDGARAASRADVPAGTLGTVMQPRYEGRRTALVVTWDEEPSYGGGNRGYYDPSCMERVGREWRVGDRVELISQYRRNGSVRHDIANIGDQGVVRTAISGSEEHPDQVEVLWDTRRQSWYVHTDCIRLVEGASE